MKAHFKILFPFLFLLFFSISIQAYTWRDIVPLHTACSDIESMFEIKACSLSETRVEYETDTEVVDIYISNKLNQGMFGDRCDVPVGTVLQVVVFYRKVIPVNGYSEDFNKYVKKETVRCFLITAKKKG